MSVFPRPCWIPSVGQLKEVIARLLNPDCVSYFRSPKLRVMRIGLPKSK